MAIGVGAYIGAASAIRSFGSSKKAKKKAKKLAKAQARLARETTAEELRRMDRDFAQLSGESRAAVGASGIRMEGSPEAHIADMESEFMRQREWTERSGKLAADVARRGGSAAVQQIESSGLSGIISGVGMIGQSQGWWKG